MQLAVNAFTLSERSEVVAAALLISVGLRCSGAGETVGRTITHAQHLSIHTSACTVSCIDRCSSDLERAWVQLVCASSQVFAQDFSGVKSGMSRAQVRGILGDPEHSTLAVLPRPPFFGPQESLVNFLKPGASYEEWQYTDGETIYLIWFGSAEGKPQESWTVVTKFSHPKGVVF